MDLPTHVKAQLGLDAHTDVETTLRDVPPAPDVANGATLAQHVALAVLLARAAATPDYRTVFLGDAQLGVRAERLSDPRVVVLAAPGAGQIDVVGAHERRGPTEVVLDGREHAAYARVRSERYDLIVRVDPGGLLECAPGPTAASAVLEEREALVVETLLTGMPCQSWLIDEARALVETRSPVHHVRAAGLVGRLWSPPRVGEVADDIVSKIASADGGPRRRAIAWFRALRAEVRHEAERRAELQAALLDERLAALAHAVAAGGGAELACAWLLQRDDLECVMWLLRQVGEGRLLDETLEALDSEALAHRTLFAAVAPDPSGRLAAVAWQEPEAWWGEVALA